MHNSPLYAAIDLGSNSFHMLVVREVAGALRTVAKVKRKVRLAAGLDPEFRLSRAAMERGWDCLRLFSEQLQDIPADNIRVVGTATLRLATNVDEFLSEAERVLNHSIEIISGEEEAKTIYEGVSWTSAGEGNRLVIDIGGASTELVIGEHSEAKLLNSLHMGCVTWLNNHFGDGELSEARFKQAIAAAKAVLEKVAEDYRALGWRTCVGASGTVQALQEIMLAQGKSERVTLPKLQELMGQAIACGKLDRLQLEGLAAERLTVFPSGLAILIAIFETLDIESMTLAGGALREGLIYGLLGNNHDCDARDRTADSLISRYQLDKEHAETGARYRRRGVQPAATGLATLETLRSPNLALCRPAARDRPLYRVQESAATRRLHHRQHRHAGLYPCAKEAVVGPAVQPAGRIQAGTTGETGCRHRSSGDPTGPYPAHRPDPLHAPYPGHSAQLHPAGRRGVTDPDPAQGLDG